MEREIKLAKFGLTVDDPVRAGEDDPELGPIMERLKSEEAKRRLAVEWYGDLAEFASSKEEPAA